MLRMEEVKAQGLLVTVGLESVAKLPAHLLLVGIQECTMVLDWCSVVYQDTCNHTCQVSNQNLECSRSYMAQCHSEPLQFQLCQTHIP